MYIPSAFRVDDVTRLAAFIGRYSFATLVTFGGETPSASHLPMLFRTEENGQGMLVSHMARTNPQWRDFASGREALTIFHGPHAYVSPSWYQSQPAVPTWNYAAVHVFGVPRIITEHERVLRLLRDMVSRYEASRESPWSGDLPEDYRDKMIQGIVAFEIPVARIEGKFKLSQNRSAADRQAVYRALSQAADAEGRAVAELMVDDGVVDCDDGGDRYNV